MAGAFLRTSLLRITLLLPLIDQMLTSVSKVHSGIQGHDKDMCDEVCCCTGAICLHGPFLGGKQQIEAGNVTRNEEYLWHNQLYQHTERQ